MSDRGRAADRPKLAVALASLKEGLRDTADPLFDSWKRPQAPAAALDNAAAVARATDTAVDVASEGVVTEGGSDVLITELSDAPVMLELASSEARVPPHDELNAPTLEMAKVELAPTPNVAAVASSLRDTVRVHVIEYPVFPRWALVAAAGLLVFAASVFALRAVFHSSAGSAPTTSGVTLAPATRLDPSGVNTTDNAALVLQPSIEAPVAVVTPTQQAPSAAPPSAAPGRDAERARRVGDAAGKSRESKPRAPGFFREPGF